MFCSYQITLRMSIIVSETACSHENQIQPSFLTRSFGLRIYIVHVVGQLPYSQFVTVFEINRNILKIFTQKNARFHALIQVDLRSFVRKKETTRWEGKKNGISCQGSKVINKPFRFLIRVRQTFYPASRGPSIFPTYLGRSASARRVQTFQPVLSKQRKKHLN